LNKDGQLHVVPARIKEKYIIRFTVTSYYTTEADILRDWKIIKTTTDKILTQMEKENIVNEEKRRFQSSLILSNVPQTPKFVNASFMAFFQDPELTYDIAKELTNRGYTQSHLPLIPRRKPKFLISPTQKGFSFDQLTSYLSPSFIANELFSRNKNKKEANKASVNSNSDDNYQSNELGLNGEYSPYGNEPSFGLKKNSSNIRLVKQTSLDSKIENIFNEADEYESQYSENDEPHETVSYNAPTKK
jgi:hypothetical protein